VSARVGSYERLLRGAAGAALVAWAYVSASPWGLLGLLLIANAVSGWCAGYALYDRIRRPWAQR